MMDGGRERFNTVAATTDSCIDFCKLVKAFANLRDYQGRQRYLDQQFLKFNTADKAIISYDQQK